MPENFLDSNLTTVRPPIWPEGASSENLNHTNTSLASYSARQGPSGSRSFATMPASVPSPAAIPQLPAVHGLPSLEVRQTDSQNVFSFDKSTAAAPLCFMVASNPSQTSYLEQWQQQQQQQAVHAPSRIRATSAALPQARSLPQPLPQAPSGGSFSGPMARTVSSSAPWLWDSRSLPPPYVSPPHPYSQQQSLPHQPQLLLPHPQQQEVLSFSAEAQLPQGLASCKVNDLMAELEAGPWPYSLSFYDRAAAQRPQQQGHQQQQHLSQQEQDQRHPQLQLLSSPLLQGRLARTGVAGSGALPAWTLQPHPPPAVTTVAVTGTGAPDAMAAVACGGGAAAAELQLCRQLGCAVADRVQTPEPAAAAATKMSQPCYSAADLAMQCVAGGSTRIHVSAATVSPAPARAPCFDHGQEPSQLRAGSGDCACGAPPPPPHAPPASCGFAVPMNTSNVIVSTCYGCSCAPDEHTTPAAAAAASCYLNLAAVVMAPAGSDNVGAPFSDVVSAGGVTFDSNVGDTDDTGTCSGAAAAMNAGGRPVAPAAAGGAKLPRSALTLDALRKMFDMPSHDVARALDISSTDLKRRLRALGIRRWPHRKLVSLQRLAQAVTADADLPPEERKSLLESVEANRSQIFSDPNADLAPNIKIQRQKQYKRHFLAKRGNGSSH